jgi:hypothetical protein
VGGHLRGRLEMGARIKFPKVETDVRRDDMWIQRSPAYMLLPFDETKRTRQRPPTSEVRLRHPHALQAA